MYNVNQSNVQILYHGTFYFSKQLLDDHFKRHVLYTFCIYIKLIKSISYLFPCKICIYIVKKMHLFLIYSHYNVHLLFLKKIVIYLNKRHKTISTILYPLTNTCGVCVCVYILHTCFLFFLQEPNKPSLHKILLNVLL